MPLTDSYFAEPLAKLFADSAHGDEMQVELCGVLKNGRTQLRVRQPRVIGPDSVLHPYPRTPPLAPGTPPADDEADEAAAGSSSGQRAEAGAG